MAQVDLKAKLRTMLEAAIHAGHYVKDASGTLVSRIHLTIPMIQWVFDAAGVCKGRKVVSIAFKLANGDPNCHSPTNTHEVVLAEGGDDHETMGSLCEDAIFEVPSCTTIMYCTVTHVVVVVRCL